MLRLQPLHLSGSRSPCGGRGLKSYIMNFVFDGLESLPLRGAWIEIFALPDIMICTILSLPLRGAWIEITPSLIKPQYVSCRSPCGGRGLKCHLYLIFTLVIMSLPLRGAWIEMIFRKRSETLSPSLPLRGAWIEISGGVFVRALRRCRSPCGGRGLKFAWIETPNSGKLGRSPCGGRGLKCLCHP